jgi:hypothetical protein
MTDIVYEYRHSPTIKRFSESRKFIRGLMGPFGSGKSSGCAIELIKWANRQKVQADGKKRARFAVIRNTYGELEDTTMRTIHDWIPPGSFGSYLKSEHTYIIDRLSPDLEIEILYRALDRPEHVAKLLSLELTGAWINEAREVPYAIVKALQGRVDRYPKMLDGGAVDAGIIMDTNPPDDESWWYELFEEKRPDNVELFRQPSGRALEAENKPYLSKNYYDNLMKGADAEFVKVYVDGNYGFVKEGKPCFPDYNDASHCTEAADVTKGIVIKRGWDFGLTPACVFTQLRPDGRWVAFDELVAEDVGITTFAEQVLLHCGQQYPDYKFEDYGDPAGSQRSAMTADKDEKTCFDILQGKGIQIEGAEQNLTIRFESVKKPMNTLLGGRPQFLLHPRCKKLRKGFQGRYQYKKLKISGAAERFKDEPDKNEYSHPHDALQYVATKTFGTVVKGNANNDSWNKPIRYSSKGIV